MPTDPEHDRLVAGARKAAALADEHREHGLIWNGNLSGWEITADGPTGSLVHRCGDRIELRENGIHGSYLGNAIELTDGHQCTPVPIGPTHERLRQGRGY